jgi:hypothetical protein
MELEGYKKESCSVGTGLTTHSILELSLNTMDG